MHNLDYYFDILQIFSTDFLKSISSTRRNSLISKKKKKRISKIYPSPNNHHKNIHKLHTIPFSKIRSSKEREGNRSRNVGRRTAELEEERCAGEKNGA